MAMLQAASHRAVRLIGDRSRVADLLRPAYARALRAVYGRRGMPWMINGQRFRVDPAFRAPMSGDYDRDVASVLRHRVRPGDVCFDIGANVGVYALQFAGWVGPRGRVVAFEPNPEARSVLQRHVRMNDFEDRVDVIPCALGDFAGLVSFASCAADGMSSVGPANPLLVGRSELRQISVPMTTLDEFCRSRSVEPDWLFLDVEGHEVAALRGGRQLIASRGPKLKIAVEMHPASWQSAGTSCDELVALLAELKRAAVTSDGRATGLNEHRTVFLEPLT